MNWIEKLIDEEGGSEAFIKAEIERIEAQIKRLERDATTPPELIQVFRDYLQGLKQCRT